jgi:hypothetical protein
MPPFVDKKLEKRFRWISACSATLSFSLFLFDDWRSNTFKVFLQVFSVYFYPFPEYPWYYEAKNLIPNSCYYMGQFPIYWDYNQGMPIAPSGLLYTLIPIPALPLSAEGLTAKLKSSPRITPFSMTPSLFSGEYLPLHIYTRDDLTFFHGKNAAENVGRQQAFIKQRKLMRDDCLKKRYPAPASEAKREVQTDQGPKDWPGKEIKDLTLPTPGPPPGVPLGAPLPATLTLFFGETVPTRPDGMSLTLSL